MHKFALIGVVLSVVVPAFLFGRAGAVLRGIAVGIGIWGAILLSVVISVSLDLFTLSQSVLLLIIAIYFAVDILLIAILGSIAVCKADEVSVAGIACEEYQKLSPDEQEKLKASAKRVMAGFASRTADNQHTKHPLFADVLREFAKSLS